MALYNAEVYSDNQMVTKYRNIESESMEKLASELKVENENVVTIEIVETFNDNKRAVFGYATSKTTNELG